ncbi:MAG: hypothetical protein IT307_08295 [Chloroflexi bacterium]|nr:hypothetical protein [Chloroflexota bacterium]
MGIVDCYLREQIVRGELSDEKSRPLDVLNNALESYVILTNCSLWGHRSGTEPILLGMTRVQKSQILIVVPHDQQLAVPSALRHGWVRKQQVRVSAGVGPLIIAGYFHIPTSETLSLARLLRDGDGRQFLPITDATITKLDSPAWQLQFDSVFVMRHALGFFSVEEVKGPELVAPLGDEVYRRLMGQLGSALGSAATANRGRGY